MKLMDIPPEVRAIIWGYALPAERKITYGNNPTCSIRPHHLFNRISNTKRRTRQGFMSKDGLNLLLTSRTIYGECEPLMYSGTTFVFHSVDAVVGFLFAARSKASQIQFVEIKLCASAQDNDYWINHNRVQDAQGLTLAAERFTGVRQLKLSFEVSQWGFQSFTPARWANISEELGHKVSMRPLTNLPSLNKVAVTFQGKYLSSLVQRMSPGDPLARCIQGFDEKTEALKEDAVKMFTLQPRGQARPYEHDVDDAPGDDDPSLWDGQCLTFLGEKWDLGSDGRVLVRKPKKPYKPNKKPKKPRKFTHHRYRRPDSDDEVDAKA